MLKWLSAEGYRVDQITARGGREGVRTS
jgi:hypothetical protein